MSGKALIVVYSYHHGNTAKVAQAMAKTAHAEVKQIDEVTEDDILNCTLLGLGAGIDSAKHYQPMLDFAETLPAAGGQKVFLFSTAALASEKKMVSDHNTLRDIVTKKGYKVAGEFSCKGYNTNSFLKFIGGMNKRHPDAEDLRAAENFIDTLID
ncbi:flavodoxin family protein [Culicoidibacter larvae]|uniref:Flavodoxin n=1 Tax=Culicoidibacter larvae TaxID=2579976 RepID=A0A5R8QHE2_9FIRM|nr:flavodoxin family protein [Culicoidibacter larvae]TLG77372.1 flavodoxin [Culicoidibacter larvae]